MGGCAREIACNCSREQLLAELFPLQTAVSMVIPPCIGQQTL